MAKNKGDTIAISDLTNNVVDLFTAAGKQVGQLAGFDQPLGMASDSKGDLYVADYSNSRIQVYAAGFASPPTTLSDPGQPPYGVDSFANGAYVAVVSDTAIKNVGIFKDSTLQRTLKLPGTLYACAFDANGNLYVTSDTFGYANRSVIYEIPNATSGGDTVERLTTANRIGFAASIQVTTAGQIAVQDFYKHAIYSYNPPSGGSLGTPTQITQLGGGSGYFASFAFMKNMADLYATTNDSNLAFEYAYPAGGQPLSTITISGKVYGTAVIPPHPKNDNQ